MPGTLVIRWEAGDAAGQSAANVTRLRLPPVAVQEAPVHVRARWPSDVVVGQPTVVGIAVQNRTPLTQDLAVSVTDAGGFVFAGDRSSSLTVLPHSTAEVRHTFVAHVAGWQPVPEVAVTLKRHAARLAPAPAFRLVCVRPPGVS